MKGVPVSERGWLLATTALLRTQSTKRMSQPEMRICLCMDSGESYGDIRQFAALL